MKYIIVTQNDLPLAIIFDEILTHKWVAFDRHVTSAGFCNVFGKCWGGSVSLGIKSRLEDSEIVNKSIERTI